MGNFQAEASSSSGSSTVDLPGTRSKLELFELEPIERVDASLPFQTARSSSSRPDFRQRLLEHARSHFPFIYERSKSTLLYVRGPRPKEDLPGT